MKPTLLVLLAACGLAVCAVGSESRPLSPAESLRLFKIPDDLRLDQVLAEPIVRQPVHLSFDARGRLWVVQYLQYPHPAGLKMLSRDGVWRAVYDQVPPPPPKHFVGLDKITIHEDTDGDGVYDNHKTFLGGLNIVTSIAHGKDGIWVLNPPYLLFYPDRNHDDVPDGDPEVHLSGFGLEDTHSVANSLCWGPDGWLYAAQGSTVTASVRQPGSDAPPVQSMGQLIWRYHPTKHIYEIFAEGGGNAFGVEIDNKGRIFSGHNGGDTRGFHYVQGGYSLKGFAKHGPLSNPYAFGYFPAMKHNTVPRFTHTFTFYDGVALPEQYRGKLFGVAPLLHHVVLSDIQPDGSTFKTQDISHPVTTTDPWFTPVDIKHGPDGALYIADWYDGQCNHYRNHEGQIDKSNGRVYRLTGKDAKPEKPLDLSRCSSADLVRMLEHPNRWHREAALRLLGERRDASVIPQCCELLKSPSEQTSLSALWALNLSGGLTEEKATELLAHHNPHVRAWCVRLLCDDGVIELRTAVRLCELAKQEPNVTVRSQLACSARRLKARFGMSVVDALLRHDEDQRDPHLPLLLWWAIEAMATESPERVLASFMLLSWDLPLIKEHMIERLMRRFAATGRRADLENCARLLKISPGPEQTKRLLAGFEAAFTGRTLPELPPELSKALEGYSKHSVVLGLRRNRSEAVDEALKVIADDKGDRVKQLLYVQLLGEVQQPRALPVLLKLATQSPDNALRGAALTALQRYDDPQVATAVLASYASLTDDLRPLAHSLLVSRRTWALNFVEAVDGGALDHRTVPPEIVQRLLLHRDERLQSLVRKCWGDLQPTTPAELQKEIERLAAVVSSGSGVPKQGRVLFSKQCGKCHTLFGEGGKVGPDLTTFNRSDLQTMLLSIVNPSAEIREGYTTFLVLTKDGRTLTGCLADQDANLVVLRGDDGKDVPIPRTEIDVLDTRKTSLMPEGLLKSCTDQEVRDLLAYLRCTQPLIDK